MRGRSGAQTALLVDLIRAAGYLNERGIMPRSIFLAGHSMGAGLCLVLAPLLRNVRGVTVAAPSVKWLMESPLNPSIHMKSDKRGQDYRDARDFFCKNFPAHCAHLHVIKGGLDGIVKPREVRCHILPPSFSSSAICRV